MPLYAYTCECGHEAEHLVEISYRDKIKLECPKCGKRLKRTVTSANFGTPKHETKLISRSGEKIPGTWERGVK
jgi:putative FmdB family regulatory protein